jgi:cell division protein FtsI (penicillin-binding protein 3)
VPQAPVQSAQAEAASAKGADGQKVATSESVAAGTAQAAVAAPTPKPNFVTIDDGKKLSVPSLVGLPIRTVIEMTAAEGLQVQISGSGTVREQAPAAGTQVPSGTKVVVRCGR